MPNPYTRRSRMVPCVKRDGERYEQVNLRGNVMRVRNVGNKVEITLKLTGRSPIGDQIVVFTVDAEHKHDFGFATETYRVDTMDDQVVRVNNRNKTELWYKIAERK